ncbi:MAG: radical SAM protein [Nitrososphaerales archaeon]
MIRKNIYRNFHNLEDLGSIVSTVGTIQIFKSISDNSLMRRLLQSLCRHCEKDKGNRLEIALELYVGVRKKACIRCVFAKQFLTPIIRVASKSFGTSDAQIKKTFKDPYWRRGLASVIKGIAWFGVTRPFVPGAPFQVVWNITRACNLKCRHCYESAGKPDKNELNTEDAIRVIDILADAGVLILAFSGGEPTVRHDILKLIKHASTRGMYVAMATNGIALASIDRVRELKNAGLQFVQISLDGIDPNTHDSFRGVPGAFKKTIQGIRNCVSEKLFVEIATTATRFNYEEIPEIVDFADELGVNWFMLYNFIPTGRGASLIDEDLTPEEREKLLKTLWKKMKSKNIEVLSTAPQFARIAQEVENKIARVMEHMHGSKQQILTELIEEGLCDETYECNGAIVPTHFYNPELSGDLKRLADFIGGCGCGRFYLAIEPNGDIYPCVFFPHEKDVKVGNILEDDFMHLWKNSKLLWMTRNKDFLEPNCKGCKYLYTCGGCRARAYNYYKNIFAPDPGCIINRNYWLKLQNDLREDYDLR